VPPDRPLSESAYLRREAARARAAIARSVRDLGRTARRSVDRRHETVRCVVGAGAAILLGAAVVRLASHPSSPKGEAKRPRAPGIVRRALAIGYRVVQNALTASLAAGFMAATDSRDRQIDAGRRVCEPPAHD